MKELCQKWLEAERVLAGRKLLQGLDITENNNRINALKAVLTDYRGIK
jgi:hypothetical protein